MISPIMIDSCRVTLRWTTPGSLATTGVTRHGDSLMTVFLPWRISGELWTLFSGQGQSFLSCFLFRLKSGIFGQTAKFGQPPCWFHCSVIGIKSKLTKQTVTKS